MPFIEEKPSITLREMYGQIELEAPAQISLSLISEISDIDFAERSKEKLGDSRLGLLAQALVEKSSVYGQQLEEAMEELAAAEFLRQKFGVAKILLAIPVMLNLLKSEVKTKLNAIKMAKQEEFVLQELETVMEQMRTAEAEQIAAETEEEHAHLAALRDVEEMVQDAPPEMNGYFARGKRALIQKINSLISLRKRQNSDEIGETHTRIERVVYEAGVATRLSPEPLELDPVMAVPMAA